MYTGYWVHNDVIYGPEYSQEFVIENGFICGPVNSGKYYVQDNFIHGPECKGAFRIAENGHIYGPDKNVPWLKGY